MINIRCLQIPTFKLFKSHLPSSDWCNLKIEMILFRRFLLFFKKIRIPYWFANDSISIALFFTYKLQYEIVIESFQQKLFMSC